MLDLKWVRENPEKLKQIILNKAGGESSKVLVKNANVDKFLKLDLERSSVIKEIEEINAKRNEIAELLQDESKRTPKMVSEAKALKDKLPELEIKLAEIEKTWLEIQSWFPNIPYEGMIVGSSDEENPEVYARSFKDERIELGYGSKRQPWCPDVSPHWDDKLQSGEIKPKHHLDLFLDLGLVNLEQGAKSSGTRFIYLLGDLVKMRRAVHRMMELELEKKGYFWVDPPLLVKEKVLFGTSHLPEGKDQVYEVSSEYLEEKDRLFLVGSSEPPNFALYMDRTVKESELPAKMMAVTPCFRSEVGSWGKDVKGIKRIHQFTKMELDVVCTADQSSQIYDELLDINKWLLEKLELPFHVVEKVSGDSGYNASARQADPEVWLTAQQEFIEVGTDTNATDFQARRMNMKYIDKDGNKRYCHTVNCTGGPDRILIAIADNYQQSDGTIKVPEVLREFMRREFIGK